MPTPKVLEISEIEKFPKNDFEGFIKDWFGCYGGREVLLTFNDYRVREFLDDYMLIVDYIEFCRHSKTPAYISVQPYRDRDLPFGIEKLFFEFDSDNIEDAWRDAKSFISALEKYYDVKPLVKFSGRKGFHVDVYLKYIVEFGGGQIDFAKKIYGDLQERILCGLKLKTLDRHVIGDLKRLERIPYTIHEASERLCMIVDDDGKPIPPGSVKLDYYRENGLDPNVIGRVIEDLRREEKVKLQPSSLRIYHGVRPCVREAVNRQLNGGVGHKMRLCIAIEFLHAGLTVDDIVKLFNIQEDFDEEKTRYYVKHALKMGYKPFKCSTIKALGFCLGEKCKLMLKRDHEE